MKDAHICKRHILDGRGRLKEVHFLTEKGLYRYLLQSRRPLAATFQDYVIDQLCEFRRKIVDDTIVENSLLRTRLELSRHDTLVAQDVNDRSLKAYNDMMIENCRLRRENKTLADAQRASRPPPGPGEWTTQADKEAYYRYMSEH